MKNLNGENSKACSKNWRKLKNMKRYMMFMNEKQYITH